MDASVAALLKDHGANFNRPPGTYNLLAISNDRHLRPMELWPNFAVGLSVKARNGAAVRAFLAPMQWKGAKMKAFKLFGVSAAVLGAIWAFSPGISPASAGESVVQIEPAATKTVVKYDSKRHGKRFKKKTKTHVHFHQGYWYASPWWTVAVPGVAVSVPVVSPVVACKTKIVKKRDARGRTVTTKVRSC